MINKQYDVVIAGGGITGTALLYLLTKYTDIKNIALLEKNPGLGQSNTSSLRNSQTLHFGDIETNYSFEKAKIVNEGASMVAKYLHRLNKNDGLFLPTQSIVLGIGQKEVNFLNDRFEQFKEIFPNLKKLNRDEIAQVEPKVMEGRDPNIPVCALFSKDRFTVNYGKLAEQFLSDSQKSVNANIDIFFNTDIDSIGKQDGKFQVKTNDGNISATVVVAALGTHSLLFAKALGYGLEYSLLPVIGDYMTSTHRLLHGKVYTVQNPKLPFAAIHGDPDISNNEETRFGPTALALPLLERGSLKTFPNFIRSSGFDIDTILSVIKIHSDWDVLTFIIQNAAYNLPIFGKKSFIKTLKKIIPNIKSSDLKSVKGIGGIRPQLVNKKEHKLLMGAAEIIGDNIIFNVTPSPGATACLQTAEKITKQIMKFFDGKQNFDQATFDKDFR